MPSSRNSEIVIGDLHIHLNRRQIGVPEGFLQRSNGMRPGSHPDGGKRMPQDVCALTWFAQTRRCHYTVEDVTKTFGRDTALPDDTSGSGGDASWATGEEQ